MAKREIEIILMRQLASYLAVPILIIDRNRDLIFFNESAEPILGRRFEETGELVQGTWGELFRPADANGHPIPREEQSLARAIDRNQPSYRRVWLTGLDGVSRVIEGLAFPLETRDAGLIGAAGIFWEVNQTTPALSEPPPDAPPSLSTHAVEVVLLRRLMDRLLIPAFVAGADGRLLFYNRAAEPLIGRPFAALGPVELKEWYATFQPTDEDGSAIKREDHLIYMALERQQPSYRRFLYQGLDGQERRVEGAAFPLIGQCERHLGAVGIFWEDAA